MCPASLTLTDLGTLNMTNTVMDSGDVGTGTFRDSVRRPALGPCLPHPPLRLAGPVAGSRGCAVVRAL
jgi:hypothetical protein